MRIELDPNNAQGDLDTTDNVYTFNFEILERPDEPVLRYLPGAVTTLPVVPLEDQFLKFEFGLTILENPMRFRSMFYSSTGPLKMDG